jgi:hypothetical protein
MRVYVGLLMLAAFFVIPANHNLSIIVLGLLLVLHLEWLALYWSFSSGVGLKFAQSWPCPLFRPRTDHACHQKPNPSRETVPLNVLSFYQTAPPQPLIRISYRTLCELA